MHKNFLIAWSLTVTVGAFLLAGCQGFDAVDNKVAKPSAKAAEKPNGVSDPATTPLAGGTTPNHKPAPPSTKPEPTRPTPATSTGSPISTERAKSLAERFNPKAKCLEAGSNMDCGLLDGSPETAWQAQLYHRVSIYPFLDLAKTEAEQNKQLEANKALLQKILQNKDSLSAEEKNTLVAKIGVEVVFNTDQPEAQVLYVIRDLKAGFFTGETPMELLDVEGLRDGQIHPYAPFQKLLLNMQISFDLQEEKLVLTIVPKMPLADGQASTAYFEASLKKFDETAQTQILQLIRPPVAVGMESHFHPYSLNEISEIDISKMASEKDQKAAQAVNTLSKGLRSRTTDGRVDNAKISAAATEFIKTIRALFNLQALKFAPEDIAAGKLPVVLAAHNDNPDHAPTARPTMADTDLPGEPGNLKVAPPSAAAPAGPATAPTRPTFAEPDLPGEKPVTPPAAKKPKRI